MRLFSIELPGYDSVISRALAFAAATVGLASPALALDQQQGLTFRIYEIGEAMDRFYPLVGGQTPNVDERRALIDCSSPADFGGVTDFFIVECLGQLAIPAAGSYGFRLTSDDGSRLEIDGSEVVDHDGVHPATAKDGIVALEAGRHPFDLRYFENNAVQNWGHERA